MNFGTTTILLSLFLAAPAAPSQAPPAPAAEKAPAAKDKAPAAKDKAAEGGAAKASSKGGKVEPAAPPEIPKPQVLDAATYLMFSGDEIVGKARYKVVKSRHSGTIFASGDQRRYTKAFTPEKFEKMKRRALRKLRKARRAHHFEFSPEWKLKKYKTWIRTANDRTYTLLMPGNEGLVRRVETLGSRNSGVVAGGAGAFPFMPDQLVLVRLATRRALSAGGSLAVINPSNGAVSTLTVSRGEGGALILGGAGAGGKAVLGASGQIDSYVFGEMRLERRAPK
jgi:hypothetical protein